MFPALAQLRSLPPKQRFKAYCIVAFVIPLFSLLNLSDMQTYTQSDALQLIGVEGRLNGYAQVWREDSTLVYLGVRYTLPGSLEEDRQPVYINKDVFQTSGLRQGDRVSLLVERTPQRTEVRDMETLQGLVLFDEQMLEHVATVKSQRAMFNIVVGLVAAAVFALAAVMTWWRHLRASADSTRQQ